MKRIKNIEFLRILGCISVILYHFLHCSLRVFPDISIYQFLGNMTTNGNKAVELFFILSGVFFAITYNEKLNIYEFVKKKIIRLYPTLLFGYIIAFILSVFGFIKFKFYNNVLGLFFLSGTPLSLDFDNLTISWYIGVLFWVLILFFYLKKNFSNKYLNLTIAIGIFISYSILIHIDNGQISVVFPFNNIFNAGILRGIGGIGVGYFIGEWYKNNVNTIHNNIYNIRTKLMITLVEALCLGFTIKNLIFYNLKFNNQIIFVLIFSLTIVLFLLNKGYISQILNKDIFMKLAKYTYSLFIMHYLIIKGIKGSLWKHNEIFVYTHPYWNIILTLSIVLIIGILTYHLIEKPATKYLKEKWQ